MSELRLDQIWLSVQLLKRTAFLLRLLLVSMLKCNSFPGLMKPGNICFHVWQCSTYFIDSMLPDMHSRQRTNTHCPYAFLTEAYLYNNLHLTRRIRIYQVKNCNTPQVVSIIPADPKNGSFHSKVDVITIPTQLISNWVQYSFIYI